MRKPLSFIDTSLDDLRKFPSEMQKELGHQLDRVQQGLDPNDWKSFSDIGLGVREIRVKDSDGIYRAIYIAKFEESVYVLHCFQKKSQTTSKNDIQLAQKRFRELIQECKHENSAI